MPTRPAHRLLAALTAVCAATFGLAAPAHAAAPAPKLELADRLVAPGSPAGITMKLSLDPAAGSYGRFFNATFAVDLSGPAGVSLVETDASCTSVSPTRVTCTRARFGVNAGTPYVTGYALQVKAAASAVPGAAGTLTATFTADDVAPATGTAGVEVAEAVALTGGARQEIGVKPGATFDSRVQVTNRSRSIVHGVVLTVDRPDWAFESTEPYANCRYDDSGIRENSLLSCRFDADLAPGETLGAVLALRLRKDTPAPGTRRAQFRWWTVDAYEQAVVDDGLGGGDPGTGPALPLTPMASARAAGAQVGEAEQSLHVKVLGTNRADLAVSGAVASGASGAVVTVTLGIRNNGPASLFNATGPAIEATVTLPTGTSFANQDGAECYAIDFSPLEEVTHWSCRAMTSFEAGQERSFDFPLRIDQVIPDATGTIVLDKQYADQVDTCNNKAKIIINPTGAVSTSPACPPPGGTGGGDGTDDPGLPITGPAVGLIAASGLLIVLFGIGALVLTRRRRLP